MTYEEILEVLKSKIDSVSDFAYEDYNVEELGIGEIEEIDQQGGEGEGDHWQSVKFFKNHNIYIKVVGFYTSHEGTDFYSGWDCCSQVVPVERKVVFYE